MEETKTAKRGSRGWIHSAILESNGEPSRSSGVRVQEVYTRGDAILIRDPSDMNKKRKIARAIAKLEGTKLVPAWQVAAVCHCDRCVALLQGRKGWREELCPCTECQHSREGEQN